MSEFPRATLRLDLGPGKMLGHGKVRLLELVEKTGSISGAAREMKMSYRRAWLLIEELNEAFGRPAIEATTGGAGGGGARLTPLGKSIIEAFRTLEKESSGAMLRILREYPALAVAKKREPQKL